MTMIYGKKVISILILSVSMAANAQVPPERIRVRPGSTGEISLSVADSSSPGVMSAADKRKIDRIEVLSGIGDLRNITNRRTDVIYRLLNGQLKNVSDLYWDPASTAQDDSVMVFRMPGTSTGRFLRYYAEIYVEWFGAMADDGVDDSYAFQKAINFCIKHAHSAKLKCGGGVFNVKNIVIADYVSGNANYVAFSLEGVAPAYDGSSIGAKMTELFTTDPQAFTIAIQHGANVTVRNISFRGRMQGPGSIDQTIQFTDRDWNGGGTVRDNRYSPHAAIVIDPFTADITGADRYQGALAYYSNTIRTGSSIVTIDGCAIHNYIVGVMVSPNPYTTNGDNIVFQNGQQSVNKIFWATGQRQTRDNAIINLYSVGGTAFLIDGRSFGANTGTPPTVSNSSIAGVTKYLYTSFTNFGSVKFVNTYMEGVWSLGFSDGDFPAVFDNCDINLEYGNTFQSPVLSQGGPVHFRNGYLSRFDNSYAQGFSFANSFVSFDGTTIQGGVPINFYPGSDNYGNIALDNVAYSNVEYGSMLKKGIYSSEAQKWLHGFMLPEMTVKGAMDIAYQMEGPYMEQNFIENIRVKINPVTHKGIFVSGNTKAYSIGNYLTTKTNIDYSNDIYAASRTGIGWVSAIRKDSIELSYIPFGLSENSNYDVYATRMKRFLPRFLGSVTAGSNLIKNITSAGMGIPLVGAYIKGTGIPVNTRVLSASAEQIVLSQPAAASDPNVEFYDAQMRATGVRGGDELGYKSFLFYFGDILKNYNREKPELDYIRITGAGAASSARPPKLVYIRQIATP